MKVEIREAQYFLKKGHISFKVNGKFEHWKISEIVHTKGRIYANLVRRKKTRTVRVK